VAADFKVDLALAATDDAILLVYKLEAVVTSYLVANVSPFVEVLGIKYYGSMKVI
jgi:hypothetical protein